MNKIIFALLFSFVTSSHTFAASSKKLYSFYDDGCEHPVNKCDVRFSMPAKLVKTKSVLPVKEYLGGFQIGFAEKNEAGLDAWDQYFTNLPSCQSALKSYAANCDK